ncbi:MAG: HU family DNA-binding protein [Bdellovibrionales bacterium]
MNKAEIIERIAEETNFSKADITRIVTTFFDTIKSTLKKKETVKLVGFGTFTANERKARVGRNPHTGEEIQIPACTSPKFKPGKDFKEYLN